MTAGKALVAIVDDDGSAREAMEGLVRSLGFAAAAFESADDFLLSGALSRAACLISDLRMPGTSGIDLCRRLTEMGVTIPTILVTAYPDAASRARAQALGLAGYLEKPIASAELLDKLHAALDRPETPR